MRLLFYSGNLSQGIDGLNGRQSFSLQVVAKAATNSAQNLAICVLRTKSGSPWLTFQLNSFGFVIQQNNPSPIQVVSLSLKPDPNKLFVATLVQDVANLKMIFYFEEDRVKDADFTQASDLLYESKNVSTCTTQLIRE